MGSIMSSILPNSNIDMSQGPALAPVDLRQLAEMDKKSLELKCFQLLNEVSAHEEFKSQSFRENNEFKIEILKMQNELSRKDDKERQLLKKVKALELQVEGFANSSGSGRDSPSPSSSGLEEPDPDVWKWVQHGNGEFELVEIERNNDMQTAPAPENEAARGENTATTTGVGGSSEIGIPRSPPPNAKRVASGTGAGLAAVTGSSENGKRTRAKRVASGTGTGSPVTVTGSSGKRTPAKRDASGTGLAAVTVFSGNGNRTRAKRVTSGTGAGSPVTVTGSSGKMTPAKRDASGTGLAAVTGSSGNGKRTRAKRVASGTGAGSPVTGSSGKMTPAKGKRVTSGSGAGPAAISSSGVWIPAPGTSQGSVTGFSGIWFPAQATSAASGAGPVPAGVGKEERRRFCEPLETFMAIDLTDQQMEAKDLAKKVAAATKKQTRSDEIKTPKKRGAPRKIKLSGPGNGQQLASSSASVEKLQPKQPKKVPTPTNNARPSELQGLNRKGSFVEANMSPQLAPPGPATVMVQEGQPKPTDQMTKTRREIISKMFENF